MANIDIDISDILWGLTSWEKQELADELYDDGVVPKALEELADRGDSIQNVGSLDFDGQVQKLIGNSWRLTKEDEETILRITNKLV
jgi:hypothetical protein